MAQLTDSTVSGNLNVSGSIQFDKILIPTTSNGTTYGAGTSGQVLKSNGTSVYWATDNNTTTTVNQNYSAADNTYPLLFSATAGITSMSSRGNIGSLLNNNLYFNPSTGKLTATQVGITTAAALQYNSNAGCVELIFS